MVMMAWLLVSSKCSMGNGRVRDEGWGDRWGVGGLWGGGECALCINIELCQPSLELVKRWCHCYRCWELVPLDNCAGEEAEFVGIC